MNSALDKIRARLNDALQPWIQRASDAVEPLTAQLRARYQKLEARERLLVRIAGGVVALFLAYNLIYLPIQDWQQSLRTTIETRQRELSDVQHLVDTYVQRKADLRNAEKNTVQASKDFSLFSLLENSLTQSVGHDKIASITPGADKKLPDGFTQYTVELKLQNVNLAQVVDALYGVKTIQAPVAVSNLQISRRTENPHSYDVDLTCIALAKNG